MATKKVARKVKTDIEAIAGVDVGKYIFAIRGQRVLLDANLAELYGVSTKRFNEAVKRNLKRFLQTSCSSFQLMKLIL